MPSTPAGILHSGGNNQLVGSGVAITYQLATLNQKVERVLSLLHEKEVEEQRAQPPKPSVPQRCEWCHHEGIPSPPQLPYLHSDRYPVTIPKPRFPGWSWRWNPDKKMSNIPPPGKRISILDVPDMVRFYDPSHELWIQESLRARSYWRDAMCAHIDEDTLSAFDLGNDLWPVM